MSASASHQSVSHQSASTTQASASAAPLSTLGGDLATDSNAGDSPGIAQPHGGLGIFRLVTTVITLIIGGGVFTLAGDQAAGGASGAAILTAWSISGIGVLCLVM
ncbi:MAG: hypothetical protein RR772_01000, partial [Gordonibacter sp.]